MLLSEEVKQTAGLSQEDFQHLHGKQAAHLEEQKILHLLTRQGLKSSKLALEVSLLVTVYYLRHYPAMINLATVFFIR